MPDDPTLFDTTDEDLARQEAARQAELSRAARQAVREGPDPRIEKSFARLGAGASEPVVGRIEPAAPDRTDEIVAVMAGLQASMERVGRQLQTVTWMFAGLALGVLVLALLVLVR